MLLQPWRVLMIARLLIAGVAIGALAAGGATAKVHHHARHAMAHGTRGAAYTYAAPAQPIPYADLDHYLKASPAERRSIEMAAANSSATSAAQPAAAETPAPAPTESAAPSPTESPTSATPPASPPSTASQPATPPASESPPMTPPATPPTPQPPPQ